MEAAAAKASSRKDLTEKQPAVEVPSDAVLPFKDKAALKTLGGLGMAEAEKQHGLRGFHFSTSIEQVRQVLKAADTGHNTVRFRRAEKFNALRLTVSSKGPIIPIEKNQKSEPYPLALDGGLARVVATSYVVPDGGHVDFTANALAANYLAANHLAGSLISSTYCDQMVGLALNGGGAVLVNPHEVLDGGRVLLANLHGAAVARVVATSYGGANGVGDVLANLYGAEAFRVVLANSYGAVDRGRVVADPDGEADRVHGGAVNMGHARAPRYLFALANPDGALDGGRAAFADLYRAADRVHDVVVHKGHARARAPADEANDARTPADEANDV